MRLTVSLELDWPPAELSPNARVHWAKKYRATSHYRRGAWYAARLAIQATGRVFGGRVVAAVLFVPPDRRRRDLDNLIAMLKPAWDGLQDAKLIEDDSAEKLQVEYSLRPEPDAEKPRVGICLQGREKV